MSCYQLTQIAAVLLTGLIAGLFYAFQCSVTGGLGQLGDKMYLTSFQAINRAILNPWFLGCFMGCLVILPLACWLSHMAGEQAPFYFLLSATAVYFTGVFGVTIFANVPLNETLESFHVNAASAKELLSQRELFERSWNRYNLIRTLAAFSSFLLTILSLLKIK